MNEQQQLISEEDVIRFSKRFPQRARLHLCFLVNDIAEIVLRIVMGVRHFLMIFGGCLKDIWEYATAVFPPAAKTLCPHCGKELE